MAKKSKELNDIVKRMQEHLRSIPTTFSSGGKIPNIIEFVENREWLGFSHYANPIALRPVQKLVLKCFYRGTAGNEHLQLTQEDLDLISRLNLNNDDKGNIVEKWNSGEIFRELVLVWGRRAGKGFITSIISLYEAMKLLEAPGGNPYKQYDLGTAAPFTILTVANSSTQAHYLYKEIRDKVVQSPYFKDKLDEKNITVDTMCFLTPHDRKRNEELVAKGFPALPGSVMIKSGHSNSDSLRGLSCFCLLLDEVGLYKNTAGASSGDAIYNALAPAVKTYMRKVPVTDLETGSQKLDEAGNPIFMDVFDGKIVAISSPIAKEGILYDLYSNASNVRHRFMLRMPTWEVNSRITKEKLHVDFPDMPEDRFRMEFGAEFSGTGGESFFPRDAVEECFRNKKLTETNHGLPGITYFAHLDPASSSHNYALVVCHKEVFPNMETRQRDYRIVVDHIKFWSPNPEKLIVVEDVDNYIIDLNRRFHIGMITYDQWQSNASIQKLRKLGIHAKETKFNRHYKVAIYDNLHELVISKRLFIPYHRHLKNELLNLQRKYTAGGPGYKVLPKTEGEIVTDDLCDGLAGACFNAMEASNSGLPKGQLVNIPVSPAGNERNWMGPQGPMGYGTGGQVGKRLSDWSKRLQQGPQHWR